MSLASPCDTCMRQDPNICRSCPFSQGSTVSRFFIEKRCLPPLPWSVNGSTFHTLGPWLWLASENGGLLAEICDPQASEFVAYCIMAEAYPAYDALRRIDTLLADIQTTRKQDQVAISRARSMWQEVIKAVYKNLTLPEAQQNGGS